MTKRGLCLVWLVIVVIASFLLSEDTFAQAATFSSKVDSISTLIVSRILPSVSIFGLLYASILAASGDESSKKRMVLVVVASIVGILAKFVVPMLQSAV